MKRVLVVLALIAIAGGAWIHLKAQLAQVLLRVAWHRQTKPWPWADTHPVARLIIGDDDFIVLEGSNGRALAFAPGHLEHTAPPGEPGNCVISAHRDTHFAALRNVRTGDRSACSARTGAGSRTPSRSSTLWTSAMCG